MPYCLFGKFNLLGGHTVFLFLPRDQVLKCDVHLLFFRVTLQFDNFHAVAQRLRNGIKHVRRRDEEYFRQVERYVQVVIPERRVLFGVERFQQRRSRIAAKVPPDLVDLVQHEDRIPRLGAANSLDDLSGQSADVGPAVSPNLSLVMHATQRNPHKLAAQGTRDRFPK